MIFKDEKTFMAQYKGQIGVLFGKDISSCTDMEKYEALVRLITIKAGRTAAEKPSSGKSIYYFSMEFLVGRFLKNYLLNLGALDNVTEYLKNAGIDIEDLARCERDPALGNGGLGRLAACFLDSCAFLGLSTTGMGIRYRFGLFKQRIENGVQTEVADNWLTDGYPWEIRKPKETVIVNFADTPIKAVPYDVPIVGFGGETVNYLRLWSSQPYHETFDLEAFNKGNYAYASRERIDAESLSFVLYPDDSLECGRLMRLKQEYFFVCAGVTDIIRKYKAKYGTDWKGFSNRVAIHTNDTHPAMCAPELMRQLLDDEGLDWDSAWDITQKTVSYTNHTVLPEALEKWPIDIFIKLLPRVYQIIEEIDRRFKEKISVTHPELISNTAILWDGQIRMANLSIIASYSVNGVATLHTEILKKDTLKDFYTLYPERFNNKTNGVSHRRFMVESNRSLSHLITETIGDEWVKDPMKLEELLKYKEDAGFLESLNKVKRENKLKLAEHIKRTNEMIVNPDSIFDVQVKRIHAYKRQHLNIFKVMELYRELKENPDADIPPTTFIFAGKAAASYVLAKEIISLICAVADQINSDPAMKDRLQVVFLENYDVSTGQIVYPAADISEQISTAGKEASGTGNMKFMFNGAVTLGTLDGANVEIRDYVGDDNIYIFGLHADEAEVLKTSGSYSAVEEGKRDPRLAFILKSLEDGSIGHNGRIFNNVFADLQYKNDEFLVFKDFASYIDTWKHMTSDWKNRNFWAKMSLVNIAKAGPFASDRTIIEYARDIWKAI